MHQFDVGLVERIDGPDIAPVVLRPGPHVLEGVGVHLPVHDRLRDDVLAEVVRGFAVERILHQQPFEQPRVEDIDAHRGQRHIRAPRHRIGFGGFLGKARDAVPLGGGHHAEGAGLGARHFASLGSKRRLALITATHHAMTARQPARTGRLGGLGRRWPRHRPRHPRSPQRQGCLFSGSCHLQPRPLDRHPPAHRPHQLRQRHGHR